MESIYIAARWPRGLSALQVVAGEAIAATLMVIPVFLLFGQPASFDFTWSSAETGIALFVAAGLVETLLYFYLIEQTGGVFVSFGTFISLFAGIAWGIVLFSETHEPVVWAAATIACLALGCVQSGQLKISCFVCEALGLRP
ncbi:MAG: hypothetical protein ACR2RB_20035 [Gammaproteobacteria bacterium]